MKDDTLLIRLTSNEKKLLKMYSEQLEISVSEFVRRQLLNALIKPNEKD